MSDTKKSKGLQPVFYPHTDDMQVTVCPLRDAETLSLVGQNVSRLLLSMLTGSPLMEF